MNVTSRTDHSAQSALPEILCTESASSYLRNAIELARPYKTIILLFEDDLSDQLLGAWAEEDRLQLKTQKVGEILSGIEVHTFGLDPFPPGTVLDLQIRDSACDASRQDNSRTAYKSLLNELSLITVRLYITTPGYNLL